MSHDRVENMEPILSCMAAFGFPSAWWMFTIPGPQGPKGRSWVPAQDVVSQELIEEFHYSWPDHPAPQPWVCTSWLCTSPANLVVFSFPFGCWFLKMGSCLKLLPDTHTHQSCNLRYEESVSGLSGIFVSVPLRNTHLVTS